jgi:hypothetical protein
VKYITALMAKPIGTKTPAIRLSLPDSGNVITKKIDIEMMKRLKKYKIVFFISYCFLV